MKKIAFFVQHMLCGGVENALISISKELTMAGNDVTIYVVLENGEFMAKIPDGVKQKKIPLPKQIEKVIPIGGTKIAMRKNINDRHYLRAAVVLKNHIFGKSGFSELNINFNKIPHLAEEYDIAVNFHMHSPFLVRYLVDKVHAKKKIAWIHNDFKQSGYDVKLLQQYVDYYDVFYGVSEQVVAEFIDIFPQYACKTYVAHTIIPVDEINRKGEENALEFNSVPIGYKKLLTVGRLEQQKGYDIAARVCKELVSQGYNFKWFILGDGSEKKNIIREIKRLGIENNFILLGTKMNPYPYFKNCDIYIQPSRHEGWGLTITEAKAFYKPIITTNFAGAREQIKNGVSGIVVDCKEEHITKAIMEIIDNPDISNIFGDNLRKEYDKQMNSELLSIFA